MTKPKALPNEGLAEILFDCLLELRPGFGSFDVAFRFQIPDSLTLHLRLVARCPWINEFHGHDGRAVREWFPIQIRYF
jgi:hypothetical protein